MTGGRPPQPGDLGRGRDLDHRPRRATPTALDPPRSRAPRASRSRPRSTASATRPTCRCSSAHDAPPEDARAAGADACLIVVEEHDDEERPRGAPRSAPARSAWRSSPTSTTTSRSRRRSSASTRRSSSSRRATPRTTRRTSSGSSTSCPTFPPASSRSPTSRPPRATTSIALERAGVDAVLVDTKKIADLVGGAPPEV